MKLLLLASPLLVAVALARGAALGRVRGNAEENRSRKMSTQRRAKGSSGKGGLFSTGKGKGSGIFHSKSRSTCDGMAVLGELINNPADQSAECLATVASATLQAACSHNGGACPTANTASYTSATDMCLAGQDTTTCYDLGGDVGQVAVQVKSAWDWSTWSVNKCANILEKSVADSIALDPFITGITSNCECTTATAGTCFDLSGRPTTLPEFYASITSTGFTIDSTVTITVLSTGDSYTGEIIPGGTVCEIRLPDDTYTSINRSTTNFIIEIEGRDYEGSIIVDSIQVPPFPSTGRIVLNQV